MKLTSSYLRKLIKEINSEQKIEAIEDKELLSMYKDMVKWGHYSGPDEELPQDKFSTGQLEREILRRLEKNK